MFIALETNALVDVSLCYSVVINVLLSVTGSVWRFNIKQ